MKTGKNIRKAKDILIDLLFPEKCLGCGERGQLICPLCLSKIAQKKEQASPNIYSVFSYKDPIARKAIWCLKYRHNYRLADRLGKIMFHLTKQKLPLFYKVNPLEKILVIPIPLSRKKKWVRGYNQSEHLAKAFCKEDKYNLFSFEKRLLFKKRETKPQAEIKDRKKRLENIKGAFFIKDKEKIMGKTILLIDDVVTTGGTLKEASLVLKEARAKKVCAFTLAH